MRVWMHELESRSAVQDLHHGMVALEDLDDPLNGLDFVRISVVGYESLLRMQQVLRTGAVAHSRSTAAVNSAPEPRSVEWLQLPGLKSGRRSLVRVAGKPLTLSIRAS